MLSVNPSQVGHFGAPWVRRSNPARSADALRSVIAAYSMRRVRANYTGPCLRVRRDSDNAEVDIGWGPDNRCDYAALAGFCGNASGWCRTWYDQFSGRHLFNTSQSSQLNVFYLGSNWGGLQAVSGVVRTLGVTDAAFNLTSSALTTSIVVNTANLGGTSFGRIFNFGSGGGSRIMMATQSSTSPTPRKLVQRPAGGVEWYSTPSGDVANGESVIVTDKTSVADINAMRSWINGGPALLWGPTRALGTMDGSVLLGGASGDTATGFVFREWIVSNVQYTDTERNAMTAEQGAFFGATIA